MWNTKKDSIKMRKGGIRRKMQQKTNKKKRKYSNCPIVYKSRNCLKETHLNRKT